jgi:hypothetical protein
VPSVVLGRVVDLSEVFLTRLDAGSSMCRGVAGDIPEEDGCILDCVLSAC